MCVVGQEWALCPKGVGVAGSEAEKTRSYDTFAGQTQVASMPRRLGVLRGGGSAKVRGELHHGHDATLVKAPSIFHRLLAPSRVREELKRQGLRERLAG